MKAVFLLSLLISTSALANTIQITSFRETTAGSRVAEVCVRVTGELGPLDIIDITADPGRNPGHYATLIGPNGNVCSVIHTYGRVEVRLRKNSTLSANALLQ